jgi:amino acid transporter
MTNHAAEVTPSLKKEIKLRQLFSLAFGTIIGVGWVTVLGDWLGQAGSLGAIVGFIGGGFIMTLIGLTYAEMAAVHPVSGGEVAYSYEVYGLSVSFMTGWLLALSYVGVVAFEVISVGWVAGALFPGIKGPALYTFLGEEVYLGSLVIGMLGATIITWLNYEGAKFAALFQDILVYGLLLVSAVFVSIGIDGGDAANLEPLFVKGKSGWALGGVLAVLATTPFWYAGFDTIPQAMGEKSETAATHLVGRVIVLAIVVATVFYCSVIVAASMVVPRQTLLGLDLPTAGAFEAAFDSQTLGRVVLFAGLLGLLSSWNAFFFAGTRVLFALGHGRMLPSWFGKVHLTHRTPSGAILFVGCLGTMCAFLGRSAIIPIVNVGGTCLSIVFFLTCVGVIRLRNTKPDLHRPYRVPGGILTACLGAIGSLVILFLSLYQPYAASAGRFPLEWLILGIWVVLGASFWQGASRFRTGIDETERRQLILNIGAPEE